jgi:hypothetical protein
MFRVLLIIMITLAAGVLRAEDKPAAKTAEKSGSSKPQSGEEKAVRATVKTLAEALEKGDGKRIREVVYAADATEKKMVDAMAAMAEGMARLRKAAAKAFGDDAAKELTGDLTGDLSRIEQAEITITGDSATVSYGKPEPQPAPAAENVNANPNESADEPDNEAGGATTEPSTTPMVFKKVDGRWRVPMSELSKGTKPAEIEQRLEDLREQTKVIGEVADEIEKGKFKNADKAAEAWQLKMMQALTAKKPETRKSTEPEKPSEKK